MKAIIAVGVLAVLAVMAFNRVAGPVIEPGTPVVVRSADPIKVFLPAGADPSTLSGYVYAEMVKVARTHGGRVEADLRAMSEDGELMDWIAGQGARRFASKEAAAIAYGLYSVTATPDRVSITTATIELFPPYWDIGGSIAHEAGHATINRLIAEECGTELVAEAAGRSLRGGSFEAAIEGALYDLGNAAHDHYHGAVNTVSAPAYRREARSAAAKVIDAGC